MGGEGLREEIMKSNNKSGYYLVSQTGNTYHSTILNPLTNERLYLGSSSKAEVVARKVEIACKTLGKIPYQKKKKDSCKYGHLLIGKNVYWVTQNGKKKRRCRICRNDYNREFMAAWKARKREREQQYEDTQGRRFHS